MYTGKLKSLPFSIGISACVVLLLIFINPESTQAAGPRKTKSYCLPRTENQKKSKQLPQCAASTDFVANEGAYHVGADGNFLEEFPDWFDPEFAHIGQKFGQRNALGVYYTMFMAFIFFIGEPDTKKVMINAGNVLSPEGAAKRYLTNLLQVELWLFEDVRGNASNLFQSLNSVRSRHINAVHKSNTNEAKLRHPFLAKPNPGQNPEKIDLRIWNAFEADLKASDLPRDRPKSNILRKSTDRKYLMNQFGMANAHFLHFGFTVLFPEMTLVQDATPTELEAYLHFWAFIGKAVGVEDEFNICLQPNLKTAKIYLQKFFRENMIPILFHLDYESKVMFEYFFKGLNNAFSRRENQRLYNWNNLGDIFLLRLLEDILEIPTPNIRSVLTRFEKGSHAFLRALIPRYKGRRYQVVGNSVFSGLMALWSNLKFNLDTSKPEHVAERGFV